MKKKILSTLLAVSMLGQVGFAQTLKDYVKSSSLNSYLDSCERFDYSKYILAKNTLTGAANPEIVPAGITVTARAGSASSYTATTSASPVTMSYSGNSFGFKAELDMTNVKKAFEDLYSNVHSFIKYDSSVSGDIDTTGSDKDKLWKQFLASKAIGHFEVEVTFDTDLTVPSSLTHTLMQGSKASELFVEEAVDTSAAGKIVFAYHTKDGTTVNDLKNKINEYLADLYMAVDGITASKADTVLSVDVSLSNSYVTASESGSDYAIITFESPTNDASAAYVKATTTSTSPGGGSTSLSAYKAYTVVDGVKTAVKVTKTNGKYYVDIDAIESPAKDGYTFDGWYLDAALTNKVEGTLNITKTTYLYAKLTPVEGTVPVVNTVVDGVKTAVEVTDTDGVYTVDTDALEAPEKEGYVFDGWYLDSTHMNPVSGVLEITADTDIYAKLVSVFAPSNMNADEHIAYISGYPDGEVKPKANITREEVVAAFYRLLDADYKATLATDSLPFPDVEADRWSAAAISAMADGGYIVGDQNGYFNPSQPITRAEFATIAAAFAGAPTGNANSFIDIDEHWAYDNIIKVDARGWISGYPDGTFAPDDSITRAEAMTIINRMLVRYGDVDSDIAVKWPDVSESDWYYSVVIEATTPHKYNRADDNWNENWLSDDVALDADEDTADVDGDAVIVDDESEESEEDIEANEIEAIDEDLESIEG